MNLHGVVLRPNLELIWYLKHALVCLVHFRVMANFNSVKLAQQNVLQLQTLGQVVEVFTIFKDSFLLELICDETIHFCCNFDSFI